MTFRLPARTPPTIARANQPLSYALVASLALSATGGIKPFKQNDWQNPRGPKWAVGDQLGFVAASQTRFIGQDKFFGAAGQSKTYDYPNPRGRAPIADQLGFIGPNQTRFLGQDKMFGAAGQTKTYDYPNPRGPRGAVGDQLGFVDGTEFWLLPVTPAASPFYQTDYPNPQRQRGPIADQLGYIDGSETWLFAGGTEQVRSPVFGALPKPASYAVATQALGSSTALLSGTVATPPPFNQTDWPNPQRRAASPLGWTDSYKSNLFVVASPFFQTDWPNPQRARGLIADQLGYIDPSETWLVPPFAQTDWPNPRGAQPAIALKTFTITLTGMIGQDQFYGAPGQVPAFDWQNPVRAKPASVSYGGHTDTYKLGLFQVTFTPFAQTDWPNPVIRPRTLVGDQLGYIDASEYWLFNAINPFAQTDWPNPVRAKPAIVSYAGHVETYKISLYQIVFVPFAQTDWPNPVRARGAVPYGFSNPLSLELFGQDTFYGAPGQPPQAYDWPTPRAKPSQASAVAYAGHLDAYKISLFATFTPFNQTDWPNPRAPRSFVGDQLGYLDGTEFWLLVVPSPFNQSDWPNPRGAARTTSHYGWQDVYKISLFAKPFAQSDWPNPSLGKQPASDLRTFVRPIAYQLLGQDRFFGPPGKGPNYDWTNPVIARRVQQPTSFATPFSLRTLVVATGRYARKVLGMATMAKLIGRPEAATLNTVTVKIVGSTLMTVHDPLDFVCGDNWALTGPLQDANGAALNLTGATISWRLDSIDGTINYLSLTLGSGISVLDTVTATILVEPTHVQTAALAAITYKDSLRVTLSTGEVFTEWSGIIRAAKNPA